VSRGEIKDLAGALGISVLAFRDPDNTQLELRETLGVSLRFSGALLDPKCHG
jgi:hypothetical protein